MNKFLIGNVIKTTNGIEVVTKIRDENYIETIPVDCTNMRIGHYREDKTYKRRCDCGDDPDCNECHGSGTREFTNIGFEKAEFIADTIEDWIRDSLLKVFKL